MTDPLIFEFITTAAPVQAEGTLAGHRFYFRSRHESWEFSLSDDPAIDPALINSEEHGFYRTGECSGGPYAASYMPLPEAEALIRRCAGEYLESTGTSVE